MHGWNRDAAAAVTVAISLLIGLHAARRAPRAWGDTRDFQAFDPDALADDVGRFVQHSGADRDEAILDDVRSAMASTSEWRWCYRDHGLMVAVPVRERLAYGTRRNAEALLVAAIQRAASAQGVGRPPVQVVFIEPEVPCHVPGLRSGAFAAGADARFADGAGGIGGVASTGDCGGRESARLMA